MTGSGPVPSRTGSRRAGAAPANETPANETPANETPATSAGPSSHGFAHASEAELARILDFYDVVWRYEPDTFPIGWNLDGDVVESFAPDFYLPDLDLYLELTTLKQKLVRKKNRKLRRLRELYPDVRIKLFYARDFRMLLLKFGRMALVDELTGTTGQATPPRSVADRRAADSRHHGPPVPVQAPAVVEAQTSGSDYGGPRRRCHPRTRHVAPGAARRTARPASRPATQTHIRPRPCAGGRGRRTGDRRHLTRRPGVRRTAGRAMIDPHPSTPIPRPSRAIDDPSR